jgi:uncharacterized membrane protein (UPF0127 family)
VNTFLHPLAAGGGAGRGWVLINRRTGCPIATHVEAAFDSTSRRRGLLGRAQLPEGQALIIAPCNAIHTWFMRFPIDVLFAARDGRIVGVRHAVGAWRAAWAMRGFATIELPAGTVARRGACVGDQVALVPAVTRPTDKGLAGRRFHEDGHDAVP